MPLLERRYGNGPNALARTSLRFSPPSRGVYCIPDVAKFDAITRIRLPSEPPVYEVLILFLTRTLP